MTWKDFIQHVTRPPFQGFRENSMIGIGKCPGHQIPCLDIKQ